MNNREHSDLLREVLGETAGFQAVVMEKTLRVARRRKHIRQAGRTGVAAAVLVMAAALFMHQTVAPLPPQKVAKDTLTFHSRPLDPGMLLSTRQPVPLAVSSQFTIAVIATQPSGYKLLGDDELLGCLAGHQAALVRRVGGGAELVFVNPADIDGFPVPHSPQ